MPEAITLSVIKADVGGYVGHSTVHPELLEAARARVAEAIRHELLVDGYVTHCGDDLELIMTHRKGVQCNRNNWINIIDVYVHTFTSAG